MGGIFQWLHPFFPFFFYLFFKKSFILTQVLRVLYMVLLFLSPAFITATELWDKWNGRYWVAHDHPSPVRFGTWLLPFPSKTLVTMMLQGCFKACSHVGDVTYVAICWWVAYMTHVVGFTHCICRTLNVTETLWDEPQCCLYNISRRSLRRIV